MEMQTEHKRAELRKLDDGTWGIVVEGHPQEGDHVLVTAQKGRSWEAVVTEVVERLPTWTVCKSRSVRYRRGGRARK